MFAEHLYYTTCLSFCDTETVFGVILDLVITHPYYIPLFVLAKDIFTECNFFQEELYRTSESNIHSGEVAAVELLNAH